MDIREALKAITNAARDHREGLISSGEVRDIALLAIVAYTNENFVYTGDIPVITAS